MDRDDLMELVRRLLEKRTRARGVGRSGIKYLIEAINQIRWWKVEQRIDAMHIEAHYFLMEQVYRGENLSPGGSGNGRRRGERRDAS
jgi:hypothetical protein